MSISCLKPEHLCQQLSEEMVKALTELVCSTHSLQMATKNETDEVFASYTPYILSSDKLYIFVSELAIHTKNLINSHTSSVMLIEDEAQAKNIFARKRLMLSCEINEIDRQTSEAEAIIDKMADELGNTLSVLRTLPDFHLFELIPFKGSYVQGFGQAFDL